MTFTIVRAMETRITETPNAVMTTLASPTVSGSATSMWLVTMQADAAGPVHAMDSEQNWHVLAGTLRCEIDGEVYELGAGDSLRISGEVGRQFTAITDVTMVVSGESGAMASTGNGSAPVVPPWIS